MSNDQEPCGYCGAAVRVDKVPAPRQRKMGQDETPIVDHRVCTDPACDSNNPNHRRKMGQSV